jgi:hypothetical protein
MSELVHISEEPDVFWEHVVQENCAARRDRVGKECRSSGGQDRKKHVVLEKRD